MAWNIVYRTDSLALPSWVPAAGAVASYEGGGAVLVNNAAGLYDPASLGYDPFYCKKINTGYSAPVFVPGWRSYGGVFFFGGGHSETNYNGALMLSLYADTMEFELVQRPFDWSAALDNGNNLSEINTYGEATGSNPLKLGGPHSYGSMVVVGAAKDKVLLAYNQAYGYANVGEAAQALQSMDLSNPATANSARAWVRESNTLGALANMTSPVHACYVAGQDRVYFMPRGGGNLKWVNWAAKTYVTGDNAGWAYDTSDTDGGDPQSGALIAVPERNLVLGCFRTGGNLVVQYIDTTQTQPTVVTATLGTTIGVAVNGAQALAWCSRSAKVLLLGSTVYEIAIPTTLTDSWTVTSHDPNIAITYPALGGWGKFEYDDDIRAIVIPQALDDGVTGGFLTASVQVYRPRNT